MNADELRNALDDLTDDQLAEILLAMPTSPQEAPGEALRDEDDLDDLTEQLQALTANPTAKNMAKLKEVRAKMDVRLRQVSYQAPVEADHTELFSSTDKLRELMRNPGANGEAIRKLATKHRKLLGD